MMQQDQARFLFKEYRLSGNPQLQTSGGGVCM